MKKILALAAAAAVTATGMLTPALAAPAAGHQPLVGAAAPIQSTPEGAVEAALARSGLSASDQAQVRAAVAALQADGLARAEALLDRAGADPAYAEIAQSALEPSGPVCAPTPLHRWLTARTAAVAPGTRQLLASVGATQLPTLDALLYGRESATDRFGRDGEHTNELERTMRDLRRFWDEPGHEVTLLPMHGGDTFADAGHLAQLYVVGFGVPAQSAPAMASFVQHLVRTDPALEGGDHPMFTFGAFAADPRHDPALAPLGVTPRVVVGDGILEGMAAVGLERTAPRSILAHEYGHHVQIAHDLFDSPLPAPQATRRTELMADAFASYFLVHKRGQAINRHRVVEAQQAQYSVGDCNVTKASHHGTPEQRLAATQWAVGLVGAQPNQGHVLGSLGLAQRFDDVLPQLVAPDAG